MTRTGRHTAERAKQEAQSQEVHTAVRWYRCLLAVVSTVAVVAIVLAVALMVRPNAWNSRDSAHGSSPTSSAKSHGNGSGSVTSDGTADDDGNGGHVAGIPTLYIHGWNGGRVTSDTMITYAAKHDGATRALTATVAADGTVSFEGTWPSGAKEPLVQVLFEDNKNEDYTKTTQWMHSLIVALQRRYHISKYNIVAHSMGNVVEMYYEERYGRDASLPKLNRQVNIAGNFDGILGEDDQPNRNSFGPDGMPKYQDKDFRALFAGRSGFPGGVDVLNVYGNLDDGTNGDSDVSVASARSLKPLLAGKAANYREVEVHGAMGQHSKLHENTQVIAAVDDFLWKGE